MADSSLSLSQSWLQQSKVPGFRLEKLNSLSAPKGRQYICELTGRPASVSLVTPLMTLYFASKQDALLAWEGIFYKLLPLLVPLRQKPVIIGSEEERVRRAYTCEMGKRALIDLTRNVAHKNLVQGKFSLAIPGAIQSLKFSKEIFGADAVENVPAYLLLAEALLGRKQFSQAQEYLGLANWGVLKHHSQCNNAIRSQLHRNFGKLYAAQGKYKAALEQLAHDVYFLSVEHGPEHINVAAGYFEMGGVFEAQNQTESALAMYDKVVDIWYRFLNKVRQAKEDSEHIGDAQLAEVFEMLRHILTVRQQCLGDTHISTGEVKFTLGLLQLLTDDNEAAQVFIAEAQEVYRQHLGDDHPSSKDVLIVLQQVNASLRSVDLFSAESKGTQNGGP